MPAAPPIEVDARVQLAALNCAEVASLEKLAPFGAGNPAPLFLVENALLEGVYPLSEGRHVRLRLRQGGAALNAVYFGKGPDTLCYAPGAQVDVVLALSIFEGKAGPSVSARVKDMRPAGLRDEYLGTLLPAQAALAGAVLGPREVQAVYPQREDTAAVYRLLAACPGGVCAEDLRGMFARGQGTGVAARFVRAWPCAAKAGCARRIFSNCARTGQKGPCRCAHSAAAERGEMIWPWRCQTRVRPAAR